MLESEERDERNSKAAAAEELAVKKTKRGNALSLSLSVFVLTLPLPLAMEGSQSWLSGAEKKKTEETKKGKAGARDSLSLCVPFASIAFVSLNEK